MKLKIEKDKIIKFIFIAVIFFICMKVDINKELSNYNFYINLKNNIKFAANVLNKSLPLLAIAIVFIAYKVLSSRWIFRIEKLNLGGMSIICSNPDDLFKQQVRNFLNTKRTLFKIDEDKDNFYETIGSYYEVYAFIRDEIKIYDNKSYQEKSSCYKSANKMIKKLNEFLTSNQNDYKRWYNYMIDNKMKDIYNKDIKEIQMGYRHYQKLITEFKEVNTLFKSVANDFDIDISKWDN